MQLTYIALIAVGVAAVVGAGAFTTMYYMNNDTKLQAYDPTIIAAYKAFCVKYNKKQSDPDYAAYRLGIFAENYNMIAQHNKGKHTYTLGENQFMDLTHAEFVKTYLGLKPKTTKAPTMHKNSGRKAAASIDWTSKGDVTAVKDQGQCGSCWAFSTTGSLESSSYIQLNTPVDLSEQQLVDCSTSEGNEGCNGGLMDYAFQYVINNGGLGSEASYPYTAVDGTCQTVPSVYQLKTFADVSSGSCADLTDAVQTQPISIGVDAETWQFYSGGSFSDCGTSLDHGVLLTGYNASTGPKGTWKVKNSWGASWGVSGYIYLAGGETKNTCGLCNTASYPTAA